MDEEQKAAAASPPCFLSPEFERDDDVPSVFAADLQHDSNPLQDMLEYGSSLDEDELKRAIQQLVEDPKALDGSELACTALSAAALEPPGWYMVYNPLQHTDWPLDSLKEFQPDVQTDDQPDVAESAAAAAEGDPDSAPALYSAAMADELRAPAAAPEPVTAADTAAFAISEEDTPQKMRWKLIQQLPMYVRAKLNLTANSQVQQQIQFYEYLAKVCD